MLFQPLHILDSCWNCRTLTLIITTQRGNGLDDAVTTEGAFFFTQASLRCFESKSKTNTKNPKSLFSFGDPDF